MHVRFTNVDSAGDPVTKEYTLEYEGERLTLTPSSNGTVEVSDELGEYLVESDEYAVESDEDRFGNESAEESAAESEVDADAESESEAEVEPESEPEPPREPEAEAQADAEAEPVDETDTEV